MLEEKVSLEKSIEKQFKSYGKTGWKERISHLGRVIWHNKLSIIAGGVLAASVWFSMPYYKAYADYNRKVSGIEEVYNEIYEFRHISYMTESKCQNIKLETKDTELVDKLIKSLDEAAKDMPKFAEVADELRSKKQHSTPQETFEYLTKFRQEGWEIPGPGQYEVKKQQQQPEKIVEDSTNFNQRVEKIMGKYKGHKEDNMAVCIIASILLGVAFGASIINRSWRDDDYRATKKWRKEYLKKVKEVLPGIGENLKGNENKEEILKYIPLITRQNLPYYNGLINAAEIIHVLSEKKDKEYKPMFDMLIQRESYQPASYLKQLFDDFKAAEDKQAFLIGAKEHERLRKSLIDNVTKSGMGKYEATDFAEKLLEASDGNNNLITLFESMTSHGEEVLKNALEFIKNYNSISLEKRLAILGYLQKDKKLRVLKELNEPFEKPEYLMKYAERLDELENIGIAGQVRFLLKIKDYATLTTSLSARMDPRIEEIIDHKFESADNSLAEVVRFFERHPNMDAKDTLDDLISYYFFSKGKKTSFEAIEMEKHFMEDSKAEHKVVDAKYERRFLKEVRRKKEQARLKAVERVMEEDLGKHLEQALDKRIDSQSSLTNDWITVVASFSRYKFEKGFEEFLKEAMIAYLRSPKDARDYVNSLEGNKNFEKDANPEIMKGWKKGLRKKYDIKGRVFEFYDAKDLVEAMNMGVVTNSCTSINRGSFGYSSIVNAVDINKRVVYVADERGKKVGRTLLALADEGIIAYRDYDNGNDWSKERLDYLKELASNCNTSLLLLEHSSYKHEERALFKKEGGKKTKMAITIRKAVCRTWYNDYCGRDVEIKDKYKFNAKCYVFNPERKQEVP